MAKQILCDRCKKVIEIPSGFSRVLHEIHRINPICFPELKQSVTWDLCEKCALSFMKWFTRPEKDGEKNDG